MKQVGNSGLRLVDCLTFFPPTDRFMAGVLWNRQDARMVRRYQLTKHAGVLYFQSAAQNRYSERVWSREMARSVSGAIPSFAARSALPSGSSISPGARIA
jgi:hypothetical protein